MCIPTEAVRVKTYKNWIIFEVVTFTWGNLASTSIVTGTFPNADVPLSQLLISAISRNNNPNLQTHFVASECVSVSLLGDSLCHIKHCFCCMSTVGFPENDFFMWHTVSYIGRGLKCSKPHWLFEPSLSWEPCFFFWSRGYIFLRVTVQFGK